MKAYSVDEIAQIVGGILTKVSDASIERLMPPDKADEKSLALSLSEEAVEALYQTKAKAALVPLGVNIDGLTTIEVERPRLAMMKLMHLFAVPVDTPSGIHKTAIIDETAKIGENVSIGANVYISRGAEIGDNTKILPNVYIGRNATDTEVQAQWQLNESYIDDVMDYAMLDNGDLYACMAEE